MTPDLGQVLTCPFCGHDKFVRRLHDIVQMYDDDETITDDHVDGFPDTYHCEECKKEVTNFEMGRAP